VEDRTLLTAFIDRWLHTVHGIMCTDSIGRIKPNAGPEEPEDDTLEKPGIENITGVSTYLGRWMDVRCLPCDCGFCGVQKASMDCMLTRWDKRLAHRVIRICGVEMIGKVSFWLLANFRTMETSGDTNGEDLYRTSVAVCVQIVHLCVLSDYDCRTLAEEHTLRAMAVQQAIESGFLNFLLGYFIPRKLCRLEDRRCETSEDQNQARRMARIACKNAVEFLLLSPDGWITDTCYNAKGVVTIENFVNDRMAPAAARLVEVWNEVRSFAYRGSRVIVSS
jgi:hypothetical protein